MSASGPRTDSIVVGVPGCVVDAADVIAWWKGNDNLLATVGPDLDGSASFVPGIIGQAISLTGEDVLSIDGFPEVGQSLTVESWIRPAATGTVQTIMSRWDFPSTDDSARAFGLFLDPAGRLTWSTDETSTRRPLEPVASAPQLFDGNFHHVAATWTQSTVAIYVDGTPVLTAPSQGGTINPATTTQFRLGSKDGIGGLFGFVGVLDEPAVIGRALSATEVRNLVDAGPNGKCAPVTGPIVTEGPSGATSGAGARWKGANSGAEVFVGPMLPPSALPRSEVNHTWAPGTTFDVSTTWNAATNTLTASASGGSPVSTTFDFATQGAPGCASASWNVLDLLVVDARADAGLRFTNVTLDGEPIGDFGAVDVAGTPGAQAWNVTGLDLSTGFTLSGQIEIGGSGFVGNEAMRVQAVASCLAP